MHILKLVLNMQVNNSNNPLPRVRELFTQQRLLQVSQLVLLPLLPLLLPQIKQQRRSFLLEDDKLLLLHLG
jgi:hypothetical protein